VVIITIGARSMGAKGGPRMGKSKARSGGQRSRSASQPKTVRQPEKPHRRKFVWLGTLGTAGIAVLGNWIGWPRFWLGLAGALVPGRAIRSRESMAGHGTRW
jgi:hypothetical protein